MSILPNPFPASLYARDYRTPVRDALAVMVQVNAAFETTLAQGVLFERRLFNGLFGSEDQANDNG